MSNQLWGQGGGPRLKERDPSKTGCLSPGTGGVWGRRTLLRGQPWALRRFSGTQPLPPEATNTLSPGGDHQNCCPLSPGEGDRVAPVEKRRPGPVGRGQEETEETGANGDQGQPLPSRRKPRPGPRVSFSGEELGNE